MAEKEKAEEKLLVVSELPQAPMRKVQGEDGKLYNLITKEEAILEILETVRELKKGITG